MITFCQSVFIKDDDDDEVVIQFFGIGNRNYSKMFVNGCA